MIYLDNAATSWPKPLCVRQAMQQALQRLGANPGRGGYAMSMETAHGIYRVRERAAEFFGVPDPTLVAFTENCTGALNRVIGGLIRPGDRVLISSLEHNAVMRPLAARTRFGCVIDTAAVVPGNAEATVQAFKRALTPRTRAIICTHASNVTGEVLPIREIGALAFARGIPFVVDAAQSAGILPVNMQADGVDFLCVPGHKGLYGPMGTGLLCSLGRYRLEPIIRGGTGSASSSFDQPEDWPDSMESGTVNVPGIIGLGAGLHWIKTQGRERMYRAELSLTNHLAEELRKIPGIRIYGPPIQEGRHVPLLSLTVEHMPSETVAEKLGQAGIAVRAGLHCAPTAHRILGTQAEGTVRLAPSAFTTPEEMEQVRRVFLNLCKAKK